MLKKWFYNPLQEKSEIEYRQSIIELFTFQNNAELRTELQTQMKGIGNINVNCP
jgi:DNA mismatch repair ATPase MutS